MEFYVMIIHVVLNYCTIIYTIPFQFMEKVGLITEKTPENKKFRKKLKLPCQ